MLKIAMRNSRNQHTWRTCAPGDASQMVHSGQSLGFRDCVGRTLKHHVGRELQRTHQNECITSHFCGLGHFAPLFKIRSHPESVTPRRRKHLTPTGPLIPKHPGKYAVRPCGDLGAFTNTEKLRGVDHRARTHGARTRIRAPDDH